MGKYADMGAQERSIRYGRAYRRFCLWLELPNLFSTLAWPLGGATALALFWLAMTGGAMRDAAIILACGIGLQAVLQMLKKLARALADMEIRNLHEIADWRGIKFGQEADA